MKKNLILLCLSVMIPLTGLYSQYTSVGNLINDVNTLAARNSTGNLAYTNIQGDPYYSEEFKECNVYLNDGRYGTLPLRYDLFQDEVQFKKDDKILWLNKKDIKTINSGNETMVVTSVSDDPGKLGYFFRQDSGKYTLFIKKAVEYLSYVDAKGYSDPIPARFEPKKDEYLLKIDNNPIKKFRTKKDLLELLGNKPEIDAYIKKEKIKIDKTESLKNLFDYLNTSK